MVGSLASRVADSRQLRQSCLDLSSARRGGCSMKFTWNEAQELSCEQLYASADCNAQQFAVLTILLQLAWEQQGNAKLQKTPRGGSLKT